MNDLAPRLGVPRGWPAHLLRALLHAISLGRVALADIWSGFENSPLVVVRQAALISRLQAKMAQLEEELRIKDARMARIPPRERPHYPPVERAAILALRAAVGWTLAETARRFFVTAATIAAWMRRLDEQGEAALVSLRQPVNRFPDFVREIVVRMKATLPTMGRRRIADLLARSAVQLAPTTVARLLERPRREPPPLQPAPVVTPVKSVGASEQEPRRVAARYNHHVWHVDLTVVGCFGFWLPWWPSALPVCWPFCWWVGAVVDQHSRAVLATLALGKEPTAAEVCAMLDRAATAAGRPPRHIISDQGVQFTSADYRAWCDGAGAKPRFGAVGKSGSIAIVERFFRSMKQECFYRILVPLRLDAMRAELGAYVLWYGQHRPHRGLDGSTPAEVLAGAVPVGERTRLEPRARYPLARGDSDGPPAVRCGKLELVVSYVEGRKHLPVFELREAA